MPAEGFIAVDLHRNCDSGLPGSTRTNHAVLRLAKRLRNRSTLQSSSRYAAVPIGFRINQGGDLRCSALACATSVVFRVFYFVLFPSPVRASRRPVRPYSAGVAAIAK